MADSAPKGSVPVGIEKDGRNLFEGGVTHRGAYAGDPATESLPIARLAAAGAAIITKSGDSDQRLTKSTIWSRVSGGNQTPVRVPRAFFLALPAI